LGVAVLALALVLTEGQDLSGVSLLLSITLGDGRREEEEELCLRKRPPLA
jgi:hypothetical protein